MGKKQNSQAWGNFSVSLLMAGLSSMFSASNAFAYRYFGTNTTKNLVECANRIYESQMRIHEQNAFLIMLIFAQRENAFGFFRF